MKKSITEETPPDQASGQLTLYPNNKSAFIWDSNSIGRGLEKGTICRKLSTWCMLVQVRPIPQDGLALLVWHDRQLSDEIVDDENQIVLNQSVHIIQMTNNGSGWCFVVKEKLSVLYGTKRDS